MFIFNIIFILFFIPSYYCLIGYDCVNINTNITSLSLSEVSPCKIDHNIDSPDSIYIQLLQKRLYDSLHVKACLISVSSIITHCGMHSHATMALNGFTIDEIMEISEEQCNSIHRYLEYRTSSGRVLTGFKPNSTIVVNSVEIGSISTSDGKCQGGSTFIKGIHYSDVIVTKSYKITLRDFDSKLSIESSSLLMSSGYSYNVYDGKGFDAEFGNVFWNPLAYDKSCGVSSHILIYTGLAYLYKSNNFQDIIVVNTSKQALAVGLKGESVICGHHGYETDHPKLSVIISKSGIFQYRGTDIDSDNIDLFLYTNSKFVYIEKHFSGQLNSLYNNLKYKLCQQTYQLLNQLVSLAYVSPEEFAWAYTHKAGVTALLRGESIYLLKCNPVLVTLSKTEKCYQEIPAIYRNKTVFLKPRTRIIVELGTEIECNPLAPPLYKFNDGWIQLTPHPVHVPEPKSLNADNNDEEWEYTRTSNLMTAGLYSLDELEKYQRKLLYPMEKPAIENIITASIRGTNIDHQQLSMQGLFTESTIDAIQDSFMNRVYGAYWRFSVHIAGFTGLIFIIMGIKFIGNMILNGTLLYKTFGFSIRLVSSIWSTLAKHFLYLHLLRTNKDAKDTKTEMEEVVIHNMEQFNDNDHKQKENDESKPCLSIHDKLYPSL